MTDGLSRQQTLQQQRAANAWQAIGEVRSKQDKKTRNEYGSLVRGLPALILSDGLGQALAFLKAKAKGDTNTSAHGLAYRHVSAWVCVQLVGSAQDDLLELVLKQNSHGYRQATTEALAYLQWIKRFAEAENWKSADGDGE